MNYAIRDYVVLVIPDWFGLALSFFVLALVVASNWAQWRVGKGWTKVAEKCAEAADGYARSDEALAGGFEQWDRPDLAADARGRAVQHREMAQQLRDRNRRRGLRGLFRAPTAPAERLRAPGTQDRVPGAAQDDSGLVSGRER